MTEEPRLQTFEDIVNDDANFDRELNFTEPDKLSQFELNYKYQSCHHVERKR